MSHGTYEYESSGGLMPMIRALVKPPDELMNPPKPKKPQHPYYKRPGKGHNRDCCDACSEGGDLICCDRCPASFHLGCYDPPLDEEDIPLGLWLCKACRASDAASADESSAPSAAQTEKRTRNRGGNSSTKKKGDSKKEETKKEETKKDEPKKDDTKKDDSKEQAPKENNGTQDKMDVEQGEDSKNEADKELSPMDLLVKAAKVMNPKQFDIPQEMKIPVTFPGTEKDKRSNPRQSSVDAWGNNIPPPAKECFVCRGNSKRAPLLQCDYCPLLFHQDCLNPPLTALPIGRWMCPNHVEQYIDWNMVNSISVTERVALWDKFSGPIDQHAIKVDFLRRARRNNPAFRVKVPAPERGRVLVPPMVQQHYTNPPPLLPSRREFVRCANVLRDLKASGTYDESEEEGETDENSKHKICMNMSCPRYTGEGPCPLDTATKLHGASKEEAEHDLKSITEPKEIKERPVDPSTSDHSDSDFEQQIHTTVKRRKAFTADNTSPRHPPRREPLILRQDEDVEELIATADDQLKNLDEKLVKLLAWQRMQQIAAGEQIAGGWRRASGTTKWADRAAAAIRAPERARLQRLGVNLQPLPSELLEREDRDRISEIVWGERPATPPPPRTPSPRSELKDAFIIASLVRVSTPIGCSIAKLEEPIPMRSNSLRVGSQPCCDVILDGKCRRVSPMHAIIFRDQVTNYFEMLNYSEWGSQVNGVMYACDLTPRPTEPPHSAAAAADARASVLRNLVGRHLPRQPRTEGPVTEEPEDPCTCPKKPPNTVGAWEGSALLPHGALLQFGCYRFVFSITDAVAFPYESKNKKPAL
ncbi:PHD finger protein 12-like isoform X2 [Epargyreus clarus]|uniref:PHD finger protein 12-like isoform X2 n=1 Tax=Epargyreus clarus TaxID=520877 RepID=UPI003C2CD142